MKLFSSRRMFIGKFLDVVHMLRKEESYDDMTTFKPNNNNKNTAHKRARTFPIPHTPSASINPQAFLRLVNFSFFNSFSSSQLFSLLSRNRCVVFFAAAAFFIALCWHVN